MNAITTSAPTKLDQFRMEILPPERRQELIAGMPPHVRPERFERNLVNAIMQNPGLMQLDPRLIFREVSKAAALGLYLDPQLGEAYLIESWNGKMKRKEPQLRIGYRGLIKLGRQSGEITMIYAHEVHKNDVFKASLGDHKSLVHEPDVFGDRGDIVGYYAVVKYQDGETDFEPLTVAQAHGIRDRSDGWKAFKDGKIKSTPWATDEVEMSKKTAIRRLTKRIPQSPELAEAIRIEDTAEHSDFREPTSLTPPVPPRPPVPPSQQISAPAPEIEAAEIIDPETTPVEEPSFIDGETAHDPDTGEIVDEQPQKTPGELLDELNDRLNEASTEDAVNDVWNAADLPSELTHRSDSERDETLSMAVRMRDMRLRKVAKGAK